MKNNLDRLMRETQTTTRQLAQIVGASPTTIQRMRQQRPNETERLYEQIAAYFGIDVWELFYTEEPKGSEERSR